VFTKARVRSGQLTDTEPPRDGLLRCDVEERLSGAIDAFVSGHRLSNREAAVFRGLVLGTSVKSLAGQIACAPGTVAVYCSRIYRKARADGREQLTTRFLMFVLGR